MKNILSIGTSRIQLSQYRPFLFVTHLYNNILTIYNVPILGITKLLVFIVFILCFIAKHFFLKYDYKNYVFEEG